MDDLEGQGMEEWERFVMLHGYRARATDLAAILGREASEVAQARLARPCSTEGGVKRFEELFSIWHGRGPEEHEWPKPQRAGSEGYEWQSPETALLASLVGRLGVADISQVLTGRLRKATGDDTAERSEVAVQVRINKIGLQTSDVVGGLTTKAAAFEVGSLALVQHAIRTGAVKAHRLGRLWVIPYGEWESWKAKRVLPPEGFVQLSTLRERLGIASDKLSEWARMGYIPSAVRCTPFGAKGASTKFGTWYVSGEQAEKLLADRLAGRAMPWHGQAFGDNMKATYKKWTARKHPVCCTTCQSIWGAEGVPKSFAEYAARYPGLEHGAKRHLTMVWTPGLTLDEVAAACGVDKERVALAIELGALQATAFDGSPYVSRTDASRWGARRCPTGESERSWMSLETASKRYLFTVEELKGLMQTGALKSKVGENGAARGIVYVLKNQCAQLRERQGFTEIEAARRAGVSVEEFRSLVEGLNWREASGIPLETVQAVVKRLESKEGYSLVECARLVGKTDQWVQERVADGTVRVSRAKWDQERLYLTETMLHKLALAARHGEKVKLDADTWLRLSDAAHEAGVTSATICKWADEGLLGRVEATNGWRYRRDDVRTKARSYWQTVRFHRARKPDWLAEEERQAA